MPESGGANVELAHRPNEQEEHGEAHSATRLHQLVGIFKAIILATVAITTAWSGYQAARFDSVQSELCGRSSRLRVEGQALELEANQAKLYKALATVLLLVAIGQRFRSRRIRVALVVIAILLLSFPIWRLLALPRI